MPTIRNNARKEVTSAKTREPHDSLGYMAEGFGCVGLWGFRGIRVRSQEALGACVYRFDL